jgi:glycosyltransferase involved in cell wall biosynthesis
MTHTIIHVTTFLQGGAGKLICELIAHQVMSGYRVLCVCNDQSYSGYQNYPEYEQRLSELRVPLLKIPGLFKRGETEQIQAVQCLKSILSENLHINRVVLIHAHAAIPAWVAMHARNDLTMAFPIVATVHGWGTNKTRQQEQQDIQILSGLDAVITVSGSVQKLLKAKGLQHSHLSCVYNGVVPEQQALDADLTRRWFSGRADSLVKIVCLGSVCDRKNQLVLLKAVAELRSADLDLVCVLIGELDEAYASKLVAFIQAQDLNSSVILQGVLPNADRYLGCFDLMVLPTRAEGMPMSVLEAFREKTLVLSSDIDECKELIKDGQSGFLFENNNAHALASKVLRIMALEPAQRSAVVERAYQTFAAGFTREVMIEAYDEIYKTLSDRIYVPNGTITSKTQ